MSPAIRRSPGRRATVALLALLLSTALPALGQGNVSISSWNLPGSITSPDVRLLPTGTAAADYFDPSLPAAVSPDKAENLVYARFHNNSGEIIGDGTVTVTADYAPVTPGLSAADLPAALAGVAAGAWQSFGSYTMNLVIPPGAPMGYGLLPGATYPTAHEVGMPSRYRITCSADCMTPLPAAFFLRVSLTLAGDTDVSDNVAVSYIDRTAGVPPADIVLVHDLSGSMSGELPLVKERAKYLLDLLNAGDRTGLVVFTTDVAGNAETRLSLSPITTIDPTDPVKVSAKSKIDLFTAGGLTPMGAGTLKGQQVLNLAPAPYPAHRAIVLLTDGRENQDPRLKDPPGYPILAGLNTDANGSIALYPLWFGTVSHWGKSLLTDIVTHVDEGKLVEQPEDDLALAKAYLMIRGILTSDDIYAIHRGRTGDGYEGTVHVDKVSREVIFTAAWQHFGREIDIELMPPGAPAWERAGDLAVSSSRGEVHVVHRIHDPEPGPWRYRLTFEREGEPHVLAALADQVEVLLQSSLADSTVAAGEPIEIRARLSRHGKPVTGAAVRAVVEVPELAIGTLLAEVGGQLDIPGSVPGKDPTGAAAVVKQLRSITGEPGLVRYYPVRIALEDPDGDGTYVGYFEETRVAGTYRIAIEARGGRSGAIFERHHAHAAMVGLGRIDPDRTEVAVDVVDQGERTNIWRIDLRAVDVHGNAADPGYADRIVMKAANGRWLGPVEDNLDGTYSRQLELDARDKPELYISVFGYRLGVPR